MQEMSRFFLKYALENCRQSRCNVLAMMSFALPDGRYVPPQLMKLGRGTRVACDVRVELGLPVFQSALRHRRFAAIRMAMPKASVYEDSRLVFGKYQVRCARQIFPVQPESQSHRVRRLADAHFGTRVFPANSRHEPGAALGGQSIDQRLSSCERQIGSFSEPPYESGVGQ